MNVKKQMTSFAKASVLKVANELGYEIRKPKKPITNKPDDIANYTRWYGLDCVQRKAFYNVGAGKFKHELWTNIDHTSDFYRSQQTWPNLIEHDLESDASIEVDNGSAAIVYTSHTIEHITDKAASKLFREAKRMLRHGGIFRATTPDIELAYNAWLRDDRDYFYYDLQMKGRNHHWPELWTVCPSDLTSGQMFLRVFAPFLCEAHRLGPKEKMTDKDLSEIFTALPFETALNQITNRIDPKEHREHPNQHVNWWTSKKLKSMLISAGFKTVYRSGYAQSATPALRDVSFFDNTHAPISLYVEAVS